MSKYICVEDFIKWTEEILCKNCDKHDDCDNCPYAEIMEDLLHFEAADVEPENKAKWIKGEGYTECSNCEYWYYSPETEQSDDRHNYCPNCGTKMDKE